MTFDGPGNAPYNVTIELYTVAPDATGDPDVCNVAAQTLLGSGTVTVAANGIQTVVVPITMSTPIPDTRLVDPVPPGCGDIGTPGSQFPNIDFWVRYTFSQSGPGPILAAQFSNPLIGCNDAAFGACDDAVLVPEGLYAGFTNAEGRFVNTTLGSSAGATTGRCCTPAGGCTEVAPAACVAPNVFSGLGSTCAGTPCQGLCCHQDGTCTLEGPGACVAPDTFGGLGTTCSANANECKGKCCDLDGFCTLQGPANCVGAGMVFGGVGSVCSAFGEECRGRCCAADGQCLGDQSSNSCTAAGNVYGGNGSTCDGNQCKGRCCLGNGICDTAANSPNACAIAGGTFTLGQDCSLYTDFIFTTGGVAPGLPMPLPIQDPPVLETINIQTVSGFVGVISDLNVDLQVTHTYTGDVGVKLEFNGITVDLISQLGTPIGGFGCPSNDFDVVLDDEATTGLIDNVCVQPGPPAATGTFVPTGLLSAFDGISPNGDWTIKLSDAATPDTGSLIRWSLHIGKTAGANVVCAPACTCKGDMNGSGTVTGADIAQFTDCVVPPAPSGCTCSDMDNNGLFNANDVDEFVAKLLVGTCP